MVTKVIGRTTSELAFQNKGPFKWHVYMRRGVKKNLRDALHFQLKVIFQEDDPDDTGAANEN